MKTTQSFEQVTAQAFTQRERAKAVVKELTSTVRGRLAGLPIVSNRAVTLLVIDWLQAEQPDVRSQLSTLEIADVIEGRLT